MRKVNYRLDISVERSTEWLASNRRLLNLMVAYRDPGALEVEMLMHLAAETENEGDIANACLALEEFKRCLLN